MSIYVKLHTEYPQKRLPIRRFRNNFSVYEIQFDSLTVYKTFKFSVKDSRCTPASFLR